MWEYIGTSASLEASIEEATGAHQAFWAMSREENVDLQQYRTILASIMAWAYNRPIMRVKDQAYFLLGLLGINMPILCVER